MSNPYNAPKEYFSDHPGGQLPPPTGVTPGLVNMVRVLAILMMVQGVLEILMGVSLVGMAVFMNVFFMMEDGPEPPPQEMGLIMLAVYGGMGLLHLVAGGLHAFAGWKNYRFRSRTLGMIAVSGGLVTLMGCYCLPTALALAIFGLIVFLDSSVTQAFQMGEEGQSGDHIVATFSGYRPMDGAKP